LARTVLTVGKGIEGTAAMLITFRGRVGSDPMQVPPAASMTAGSDDSFAQVLEETVAAAEAPVAETTDADDTVAASPDADQPAGEPSPDVLPEPASRDDQDAVAEDDAALATARATVAAADPTDDIRRGEPVRQDTAGKGADSPRTSSSIGQDEPWLAALVQQKATPTAVPFGTTPTGQVAKVDGASGVGATTAARGLDAAARANTALRAPTVAAGYRTSGAASAELLEQARDSVFKQILLQLTEQGGEMRLRLDPPELGELDLRLVVEHGNRMSLAIAAERGDLAQLLQHHLDELKQSLQQAGLEVTGASVQTRSEFARDQQRRDDARDAAATFVDAPQQPTTTRPRAIAATGLEFWA
jgi:flagellar hook-length control protein FliK